jgi:hypothetical protein
MEIGDKAGKHGSHLVNSWISPGPVRSPQNRNRRADNKKYLSRIDHDTVDAEQMLPYCYFIVVQRLLWFSRRNLPRQIHADVGLPSGGAAKATPGTQTGHGAQPTRKYMHYL